MYKLIYECSHSYCTRALPRNHSMENAQGRAQAVIRWDFKIPCTATACFDHDYTAPLKQMDGEALAMTVSVPKIIFTRTYLRQQNPWTRKMTVTQSWPFFKTLVTATNARDDIWWTIYIFQQNVFLSRNEENILLQIMLYPLRIFAHRG